MGREIKNPVIPRGLGRKLKKEVVRTMPIGKRAFRFHAEILNHSKGKNDKGQDGLFIEGYASTKDIDRTGEVVEPSAFADALDEYMQNPVLTYMHDWSNPIGKVVEAKIDDNGLWVKAFISSAAGRVIQLIQEGILKALSIGYEVLDEKVVEGINHLLKVKLYEIAVVSIPANQRALFSVAKALERGTDLEPDLESMRLYIAENPDIRSEIQRELEAELKEKQESADGWRNIGAAIAQAGEIAAREEELADEFLMGVGLIIGEVRELAESGEL